MVLVTLEKKRETFDKSRRQYYYERVQRTRRNCNCRSKERLGPEEMNEKNENI